MKTIHSKSAAVCTILAVSLGLCSFPAFAQKLDLGGNFLVGLPQNEFRENIDRNGAGLSGHIGHFLGEAPIMIGADLGYMNYGIEKRREPLSLTIPDITVDVRTTNNILMFHGFARIQPQTGSFRPYMEGLWGVKYLFTRTSIKEHWYEETIASSTNFDDFAGSWGVGFGVDIGIWKEHRVRRRHGSIDVSLNLSARYLFGSEAEYLKEGSIWRDPDGSVTYYTYQSKTDMFLPQVGIRVRF